MNHTKFALLTIVALIAATQMASGQDRPVVDYVEHVRKFGRSGGDHLYNAAQMLRWQLQLSDGQTVNLEKMRTELSKELDAINATIDEAKNKLSELGLPSEINVISLKDLAAKQTDSEVQLRALDAKRHSLERLVEATRKQKVSEEAEAVQAEMEHLAILLGVAQKQFDYAKKLHEKGHMTELQLSEHEGKVAELNAQRKQLQVKLKRSSPELMLLEKELVNLTAEIESQGTIATDLKQKLTNVKSPVNELQSLNRRKDFLERNIEQIEQQVISIRIRDSEKRALLEQIELQLNKQNPPQEKDK